MLSCQRLRLRCWRGRVVVNRPCAMKHMHAPRTHMRAHARMHTTTTHACVRACGYACVVCVRVCVCVCARARVLPTPIRIAFGVNPWRTRSHAHDNTGPATEGENTEKSKLEYLSDAVTNAGARKRTHASNTWAARATSHGPTVLLVT